MYLMSSKIFENILKHREELKNKFLQRKNIFGGWVSYPELAITETICNIGVDFLSIDMEHTTISIEQAKQIIRTSQGVNVPCIPRPVSHAIELTKPILDSGSDGILYPLVENSDQVEQLINNFKFPLIGKRSFGVNRAHNYGFDFENYINSWNDSSLLLLQIESIEGVKNIDKILNFSEVDGVMIGPYDLSGSLGVPGEINHPLVKEAAKKVLLACIDHNKTCGTQIKDISIKNLKENFEFGYNLIFLSSDLFVFTDWALTTKENIKKL